MALLTAYLGHAGRAYVLQGLAVCAQATQRTCPLSTACAQRLSTLTSAHFVLDNPCSIAWPVQHRKYSSACLTSTVQTSKRVLDVADLPPYIILLRHGEVGAVNPLL